MSVTRVIFFQDETGHAPVLDWSQDLQEENVKAWAKFREKGVEVLRLSEADITKFRKLSVPLWFEWAKKDPLATQAFKSQLDFMRSENMGYVNDAMLVDAKGQKLTI